MILIDYCAYHALFAKFALFLIIFYVLFVLFYSQLLPGNFQIGCSFIFLQ